MTCSVHTENEVILSNFSVTNLLAQCIRAVVDIGVETGGAEFLADFRCIIFLYCKSEDAHAPHMNVHSRKGGRQELRGLDEEITRMAYIDDMSRIRVQIRMKLPFAREMLGDDSKESLKATEKSSVDHDGA